MKGNIRVYARVRPLSDAERSVKYSMFDVDGIDRIDDVDVVGFSETKILSLLFRQK